MATYDRGTSQAALLELRRERQVIEDGHRFLDEKRVLLAHEILRRLEDYERLAEGFARQERSGLAALRAALAELGLEELQLYPVLPPPDVRPQIQSRAFLGVDLVEATWSGSDTGADRPDRDPGPPAVASATAVECGRRLRTLATAALPLAAAAGNLRRLAREYRVTERRVRALENVLLPEVRAAERRMADALEEVDQEDVVRVRLFAGPRGGLTD